MAITVSDCIVYPLKSGIGIPQAEVKATPQGLEGDRRFMLVDVHEGNALTQKHLPALAMFSLDDLAMKAPVRITNDMIPVTIWGKRVKAFRAHDETNAALSDIFGSAVRMVMFPLNGKRSLDPAFSSSGDTTMFADEFPVLLTSESSLDALAPHFKSAVTMDRFRPNIVLRGMPPFAEDTLKRIKIGDTAELEIVKNCTRCAITTIDQKTGLKDGVEPLATLGKLRWGQNGVYFGAYAIPRKTGMIRPGDVVEVLERRPICPDMAKTKMNGPQFGS